MDLCGRPTSVNHSWGDLRRMQELGVYIDEFGRDTNIRAGTAGEPTAEEEAKFHQDMEVLSADLCESKRRFYPEIYGAPHEFLDEVEKLSFEELLDACHKENVPERHDTWHDDEKAEREDELRNRLATNRYRADNAVKRGIEP